MPMILKFTCLYPFPTLRNLLRSCNICNGRVGLDDRVSAEDDFLLIGTKLQREKILNNSPCLILGLGTNPSASAKKVFDSSPDFRKDISQKKKYVYTVYPKHVGHASIISVTCVELENNCPLIFPSKLQWHSSVAIVQLLLLYVQWGPRNYEKCKMFRLIPIIMMSLNKFRFVAQAATLGNFFY